MACVIPNLSYDELRGRTTTSSTLRADPYIDLKPPGQCFIFEYQHEANERSQLALGDTLEKLGREDSL